MPDYDLTTTPAVRIGMRAAVTTLACCVLLMLLAAAPDRAHAAHLGTVWSPLQNKHANIIDPRHLGPQITTWYGPRFFGNRTGCGRTLRTTSWGIAHRTLPCGQLVWLRYKGRQIAVPVIDRGPYGGASVDLTARTSRYLRFTSGSVNMSVMKRVIPIRQL